MNTYYIIAIAVAGLLFFLLFMPKPDHRQKYLKDSSPNLANDEKIIFHGQVEHWQVSNPMFETFQKKSTSPRGKYVILTNRRFLGFTKTFSVTRAGYDMYFGAVFQNPKDKTDWSDKTYWSGLYGIAGEHVIVNVESFAKSENKNTFHTVNDANYKLNLYGVDDKVIEKWKQVLLN